LFTKPQVTSFPENFGSQGFRTQGLGDTNQLQGNEHLLEKVKMTTNYN
jgi:hypothetical protein